MTRISFSTSAFAAALVACAALGATAGADDSAGVARITDQSARSNVVIRANDDAIGTETDEATPVSATSELMLDGDFDHGVDDDCSADGFGSGGSWWSNQVAAYNSRRHKNVDGIHYSRHRRYSFWASENAAYRCRNQYLNAQLHDHLRCKFGYFIPTGCCGTGCPIAGRYAAVYAVDPNYFDPRDGGVFSAQGYGVPMAVPLAPTVGHTYNYSWGLPASRLTPISHPAPIPAH